MTWAPCPHGVRTRGKKTVTCIRRRRGACVGHWPKCLAHETTIHGPDNDETNVQVAQGERRGVVVVPEGSAAARVEWLLHNLS